MRHEPLAPIEPVAIVWTLFTHTLDMSLDGSVGVLSEGSSLRRCKDHPGPLLVFAFPLLPIPGLPPGPAFPGMSPFCPTGQLVPEISVTSTEDFSCYDRFVVVGPSLNNQIEFLDERFLRDPTQFSYPFLHFQRMALDCLFAWLDDRLQPQWLPM